MNKKLIDWWTGGASSLNTSLVSYWKFDANANDSVGSNNGTLNGSPSLVTGIIGNCYNFNAGTKYIVVNDAPNLTFGNGTTDSPFSFSMWLNPNSYAGLGYIISKRTNALTVCEYAILLETTGKISLLLFSQTAGANYIYRKGNIALTTGAWYHLVVTYDGTGYNGLKIYVNNVLSTGDTNATVGTYVAMDGTSADLRISTGYAAGSNGYNGLIDELALWSKVLTVSEINSLYNSGAGRQYPF